MLPYLSGKYKKDIFYCKYCRKKFQARVTTWVDVSKTPEARLKLLRWEFNLVRCPACGYQAVADSPFFYEDFEEGLLIAVIPSVPDQPAEVEGRIRSQYSYYPRIDFFYDMVQIWFLVYLYFYDRENEKICGSASVGMKEKEMQKIIRFIKTDAIMLHIRQKIEDLFREPAAFDSLVTVVERAIHSLDGKRTFLPQNTKA